MKNIEKLATTKKLKLTDEELAIIDTRAKVFSDSFSALEKINVDSVEPLISVLDVKNVLREDTSVKKISRDELLSNAPEQYDGYFQVPKAIDGV